MVPAFLLFFSLVFIRNFAPQITSEHETPLLVHLTKLPNTFGGYILHLHVYFGDAVFVAIHRTVSRERFGGGGGN